MIGFGTWRLTGATCEKAVAEAYQCGYRLFDTATMYGNLAAVGRPLAPVRDQCTLTSKVWHDQQKPAALDRDFEKTLKALDTDYLDTYLIHWPNSQIPIEETLGAMQRWRERGALKQLGLCNTTVHHLRRALQVGIPIDTIQVEMSPKFYDPSLLTLCREEGIQMQAWAPLDRGRLATDSTLAAMAREYDKSPAQIALRWIIQMGVIPLPGSSNPAHIRSNFTLDFTLTQAQVDELATRAASGQRERYSFDEFDFGPDQCWPN